MDSGQFPNSRPVGDNSAPPPGQTDTRGSTSSGQTVTNNDPSATARIGREQFLSPEDPAFARTVGHVVLHEPLFVRLQARHRNIPTPKQCYKYHELVSRQRIHLHADANTNTSAQDFEFTATGFKTTSGSIESRIAKEMVAKGLAKLVPSDRNGWLTVEYLFPYDLYHQIQQVEDALSKPAPVARKKLSERNASLTETNSLNPDKAIRPDVTRINKRSVSPYATKSYLGRILNWIKRRPSSSQKAAIVDSLKTMAMQLGADTESLKLTGNQLTVEKDSHWHQCCLVMEAAGLAKVIPATSKSVHIELKRPVSGSLQLQTAQLLFELPPVETNALGQACWKETLRTMDPTIAERLLNKKLLMADKDDYRMARMTPDNLEKLQQIIRG